MTEESNQEQPPALPGERVDRHVEEALLRPGAPDSLDRLVPRAARLAQRNRP